MSTQRNQPEALIFDLDGTLFRTETLLLPAYRSTFEQLRDEGLYHGETPPTERFVSNLGLLLSEIWQRVLPDAPEEVRSRANELLLHHQIEMLKHGVGEMYPGVEATLKELHNRGYRLFVASNGLEAYVKEVMTQKGLASLFTALFSAGEFQTKSKVDLVRLLLETYRIQSAWMCGDRTSDVEAGIANGLYVIGCDYGGFHQAEELRNANVVIRSFPELLGHLT